MSERHRSRRVGFSCRLETAGPATAADLLRRESPAPSPALTGPTAQLAEDGHLIRGLDALGDNADPHGPGQVDDGRRDGERVTVLRDARHEAAIDLQQAD